MSRPHVVIVSAFVPSQGTGSGIVLLRHVERFCASGVRVTVVAPEHAALTASFMHPLLQSIKIPKRLAWWPPVREWLPQSLELRARLVAAEVARHLQYDPPNCILSLLWGEYPRVAMHVARRFAVAFNVIIHDQEELWHTGVKGVYIRKRNEALLEQADHVFPVSDQQAIAYGVPDERVSQLFPIPGAVVHRQAGKVQSGRPVVVSAGSIHEWHLESFRTVAQALDLLDGKFVMIASKDNQVCQATRIAHRSAIQIDPFSENEKVVEYIAENATAYLVSYAMDTDKQRWGKSSFPSKLLEFSRTGVPPIVICPEETVLARWGRRKNLPLLWTSLNENVPKEIADRLASGRWMGEAQKNIEELRESDFDPSRIHSQLALGILSAENSL